MLNEQPWIVYSNDLYFDWQHAVDEGKDVLGLKAEFESILLLSKEDPNKKELSDLFYQKLLTRLY